MVNPLTSRRERPQVLPGQRIYAIGDIHGRADLLQALFDRIDADLRSHPAPSAIQVFLGDYMDRGPNSRHVLDLLVSRKQQHETVFLKGNHEAYVCLVLNDASAITEWQRMGGISTLLSYGVTPSSRPDPKKGEDVALAFRQAFPAKHRRFVNGLALSFTCGDFFFAHAGVRPGIALQLQRQEDLLWIRDDFLLHEDDFGKIVVHGHTPTNRPDVRPNRINIDTGAYATGRLTCLVLEGDQMRFI